MVPQTTYWLFSNSKPVGYGRIRHFLDDNLQKNSGHIGYAISRSERGKGYGNQLLKLLLKQCLILGIREVQTGVSKSNYRSQSIVENNGGELIRTTENKNIYKIVQ